jgi:DNA segregation ATPase FtsK/SpoIIIE, S-DNA-T family
VATTKPPSSARRDAKPKPPPRGSKREPRRSPLSGATTGHESDLIGIAFIAAAVLTAMAVWFDLAGPIGRVLDHGLSVVLGYGRVVVPAILGAVGGVLVADRWREAGARTVVGAAAITASFLGLLHIAGGPERWDLTELDPLREGGGLLGAVVGHPLRSLLAPWGGAAVLIAVALGGAVLITGWTVRRTSGAVARGVAPALRRTGSTLRRSIADLGTLRSADAGRAGAARVSSLYDVADDLDDMADRDAPTPRKRRARTKPTSADGEQLTLDESADGSDGAEGAWRLPPAALLKRSPSLEIDTAAIEARGKVLEQALAAHGVETRLVGMTVGPTVTRYELELGSGVKVARVTSLNKDIAYAMASPDVRILAPIPGKSAIGIEVPNVQRQLVALGDILASAEAKGAAHPLDVAVGRDISGRSVMLNLAKTPHLLIAGQTGAGKSSGINCLITSLLMRTDPDHVKLILIDPKRVEMSQYQRLPHLLTQVVTNPKKAANALSWSVREMERRLELLSRVGSRDISSYNAAFDRGELQDEVGPDGTVEMHYERLPFIVLVVDELNDLMMVAARDVEESITRIAQMARAVGIHLVIATQRPSVNVITGVIKANIPARMAFAVSSATDSRVVLDQIGAERLIGQGDMLLLGPSSPIASRIQGAFVGEDEIRTVVAHWRRQTPTDAGDPVLDGVDEEQGELTFGSGGYGATGDDADDEQLVLAAMDLVVRSQLGSTSMLQRKLKVGFARAGRIMDLLEQRGVVGPSEGSKARSVLMTVDELEDLQRRQRG